MFEIGFSEIVVIMVVALVVLGPERLPQVARTLGHLWGRAQRYIHGVRADIERDMQMDELRKLKLKMEQEVESVSQSANQTLQAVNREVEAMSAVEVAASEAPKPLRSVPVNNNSAASIPAPPEQQKFPID